MSCGCEVCRVRWGGSALRHIEKEKEREREMRQEAGKERRGKGKGRTDGEPPTF
jgi:hypothetical protein